MHNASQAAAGNAVADEDRCVYREGVLAKAHVSVRQPAVVALQEYSARGITVESRSADFLFFSYREFSEVSG